MDRDLHIKPGLTPLARAHATGVSLGKPGQDIGPLIAAMEQTRRDALEEAAGLAECPLHCSTCGRLHENGMTPRDCPDEYPSRCSLARMNDAQLAAAIRQLKDKPA